MAKVKILKPYGLLTPGEKLDISDSIATLLAKRGIIEYIKDDEPVKKKKGDKGK